MSKVLRSRGGIAAGALLALCLAALPAVAQGDRPVTTSKDRGDSIKVNVTGRVNMDYVIRSGGLTILPGMNNGGFAEAGNSWNTVEGEIALRLTAELSDKVSAVIEVARLRVDENASGVDPFFGNGGDVDNDVVLREAHILLADFLMQGLTAQAGIVTWSFDTRGKGSAFAFGPHYSQQIVRNFNNTVQEDTATWLGRYGISNAAEMEAVGLHLAYQKDALTVDFVALPVIDENGAPSQDEALYALDFWYALDSLGKGSKVGVIAALINLPATGGVLATTGSDTRVFTIGAGVDLMLGSGLELYAEGHIQKGSAGRQNNTANDVDMNAQAFTVGIEYRLPNNENNIWVGASFTVISGDDDTGVDDEVNSFISYENVNDFLVVEDMYFGLDIDTNYTAIKIMGGLSFSMAGGKNNVELMVGLGIFTATEELSGNVVATDDFDEIGNEFDVKLKYHVNKQASLGLNFGVLTGSDLLEDAAGGSGVDEADDQAWVASLGFNVKF